MKRIKFKMKMNILFVIFMTDLLMAQRVKRALIFTKNSKLFFRLNGKDNVIPWVQIFAHGYAIRVNYDLPENIPRRHQFFKRDIHEELEIFDTLLEFKLFSCTMHNLCTFFQTVLSERKCKFFCQIAKIFQRSKDVYVNFFNKFIENCDRYRSTCKNGNYTI